MSFRTHDPFRRSRGRANVLRTQRARRATAGAAVAVLLGGVLLMLPGNASSVKAGDGAAIARVTRWVRHAAHVSYIDLVHQADHGAALVTHRAGFTNADFLARRNEI